MTTDKFKNKLKTVKKSPLKKIAVPKSQSNPTPDNTLRAKTIDLKRDACCFNCSIIKHNGIHLAYRKGDERINYVELVELDEHLNPLYHTKQKLCEHSSEDPRIWTYKDDLYCSWTSVKYKNRQRAGSNIEVYRIKDKKLFTTNFNGHPKQWAEKNWTFFNNMETRRHIRRITPSTI
jgi:hypothetical protein